jgi:hypothetical protein
LRELVAVREEAEKQFPKLAESANIPTTSSDYADSIADFDSLMRAFLGRSSRIDEGNQDDENAGSARPVDILWTALTEFLPSHGVAEADPALSAIKKKVGSLRERISKVRRSHAILESVHPGARWAWVQEVMNDCDPEIGSPGWHLKEGRHAITPYRHYWKLFQGRALDADDSAWLETFRIDATTNVQAVRAEFHSLLGSRASATWLLQRYAKRTRLLHRKELQKILRRPSVEKNEISLTVDAALFLFDQGIDVLTEQSRGQHRYDIIGRAVLVEAKIQSRRRSGLATVVDGLNQIAGYHAALRQEGTELDPVVLVFRVGGRQANLPPECRVGNLSVAIVYVDLGDSSESGSRTGGIDVVTRAMVESKVQAKVAARSGAKRARRGVRMLRRGGR